MNGNKVGLANQAAIGSVELKYYLIRRREEIESQVRLPVVEADAPIGEVGERCAGSVSKNYVACGRSRTMGLNHMTGLDASKIRQLGNRSVLFDVVACFSCSGLFAETVKQKQANRIHQSPNAQAGPNH